ncbi:MAG: hypothetical protein K0M50_02935 [Prolixibacteraceae bacterium]|nr:hypothetical protein [Prolixibacteraceae bacterium]
MKTLLIFTAILLIPFFFSCRSKHRMKAGKIDLEVIVYHDPGGDLNNSNKLPVSTIYFLDNEIFEKVPILDSLSIPLIYYIKDKNFYQTNTENYELSKPLPLSQKKTGAMFIEKQVPEFETRVNMNDTTMNGVFFKRAKIVTPSEYSVFYIHPCDSIIPYSLSKEFDKEYKGILKRIDTYDRVNDRFISLRLNYTNGLPQNVFEMFKNLKNAGKQ